MRKYFLTNKPQRRLKIMYATSARQSKSHKNDQDTQNYKKTDSKIFLNFSDRQTSNYCMERLEIVF